MQHFSVEFLILFKYYINTFQIKEAYALGSQNTLSVGLLLLNLSIAAILQSCSLWKVNLNKQLPSNAQNASRTEKAYLMNCQKNIPIE
jgi:hypothetical protein